jgi:hypothetical protein
MKFTKFEKEFLHGLVLGDGHVTKQFIYTQTFGQHAEPFAQYVFDNLRRFCTDKGMYTYQVRSGKDSPLYQRWIVRTRTLDVFKYYHDLYYRLNSEGKYIKILPKNIETILTPTSLALFLMSDGGFHKTKHIVKLATNNFTKAEVELLSISIFNKFGVESKLEHGRKEQYVLRFRKSVVPQLQKVVKDRMIPSMMYRIGL